MAQTAYQFDKPTKVYSSKLDKEFELPVGQHFLSEDYVVGGRPAPTIPFTSPTGIVSSTTGLREQEYKNKVASSRLLGDVDTMDKEQMDLLGTVLNSTGYNQTPEGQVQQGELDQLRKNLGILTPQEEAAITDEGRLAGGQFDDLIRQAEQEKMKGLPKALIRAGEQGGLMNSQFAGAAATNQTVGGDFFGAGGELEEIKSVYDQNIASLKSKREMAVLEARRAARAATLSGKKEDYQLAQQAFKDAQEAHNASIQLAKDKVDAIANYQTKKREGIKFQQEQQATRAKQLAPLLIDVDDSGEILVANNEEILRMAQQEGVDPNTLISEVNLRIDAVMKLNREERKGVLEEMKLQGDILNQGKTDDIKEYTFSKQQGYTGSFADYMKEKKVQEVSLPNSYKEWQLAGSPGSYADFLSGSGVSDSQAAREQALAIMAPNSTATIEDVPIKQRLTVQNELNKLKNEALQSGDIYSVIRASAGGKDASDTFKQSFEKALNVIDQISNLKGAIEGESTGPIWGIVRSNNPYDTKAQQIKAQITAIVPNLARGVYGEVGVLTDNDIALYSKTLPNLKSTQEVSEAVLGITIRSVQRSIENKIKSQAGFGVDMSGIEDVYREVKAKADELLGTDPSVIQALSKQYGYSVEDVTALINGDGTNPGLGEEQARAFLESQKQSFNPVGGDTNGASQKVGMRTDRHNNLIAAAVTKGQTNEFTNALDKKGIAWSYGDPFPDNPNMVTIRVEGDPIEASRAILSDSKSIQNWYINHTGKEILNKYGVRNNDDFKRLDKDKQNEIIKGIYDKESGGKGTFKFYA